MKSTAWSKLRNRTARAIANWALSNIATYEYQHKVYLLIRAGIAASEQRLESSNFLDTKEQPK